MDPILASLRESLFLALLATAALWLLSLRRRDASIIDPFWGAGFALISGWSFCRHGAEGARSWLALGLASAWGLRLCAHLLRRSLGHAEDFRYQAMREAWGARFWWVSLFSVFWLQAALMWLISWPLQAAITRGGPLGVLGWLGAALWLAGFAFEAIGDEQLRRFKADPANRGRVLDGGLWRYTRHPNYFGDALLWWGFWCLGADGWTLISPALMSFLLVRVSGVSLLERALLDRKPGYRAYVERTSSFIPWPPRGTAR